MKDISVYNMLGLSSSQIYIVGRPSKKYQNQCQVVLHSCVFCNNSRFCLSHERIWLFLQSSDSCHFFHTVFSSLVMVTQHTSPPFSLGIEQDPRNLPLFVWSWEKAPLVSRQSLTSCVSARTWEEQCQCNSRTHRAHPTRSLNVHRASQSQIRITGL